MDKLFKYRTTAADILPSLNIGSVMGYPEGEVPEPFAGLIESATEHAHSILEPRAVIQVVEGPVFHKEDNSMSVGGNRFSLQNVVYNMVKRSSSMAFFICTIGPALPEIIRQQNSEGDLLSAYVYDILGTLSVEAAMDVFQSRFKVEMNRHHLNVTNRYSPGYCNWDIKEQELLFQVINDDFTGVELSSSCLMQPIKSISGIIGIGEAVKFNRYTCSRCDQQDCLYVSIKAEGRADVI